MSRPSVTLDTLQQRALLREIDLHFAHAIARLGAEREPLVVMAAALASRQVQAGHVCLDLPKLCHNALALDSGEAGAPVEWPALETWLRALRASALVGRADSATPLHLDEHGRLYLRRYFEHEQNLALAILERVRAPRPELDRASLRAGLDRMFGRVRPAQSRKQSSQLDLFGEQADELDQPDAQRTAAERAVERKFCVITGGPGTGKTATVVKILALLIEQAFALGQPAPRIRLLAPTGKAAARLSESIARARVTLPCTPRVRDAIRDDASTIHRALGKSNASQQPLHDSQRPLGAEVVVVDEASMVDLALMARLVAAVAVNARLILLGDKNQLASVEAGAVLGDICGAGLHPLPENAPITNCIVQLSRSYRYAPDSGIRLLADAINQGDALRTLELLRDPAVPDVSLLETAPGSPPPAALFAASADAFSPFFAAEDPGDKLRALERFRVLCAHRHGSHGQLAVNAGIEAELLRRGTMATESRQYAGRALMVTENDYQAQLFNGDVGVLVRDPRDPARLRACFSGADGKPRELSAARLPPHESAYAMSVHKSQGSELDEVALLLPSEASPLLSRELLYTAVTRARRRVVVYANPDMVALAVRQTIERASGLRDALWRAG
jgi:exodeoxyribonuclease V alpha subunit